MSRVDFDPETHPGGIYRLLNSVVVPRPIAWVSTRSPEGVDNLAPHSFFTVACSDPPMVQFTSIGRKDSLGNATATGEFVVNLAPRKMAGVVSEGMLFDLGYEDGVTPMLAVPERPVPNGTRAG